MPCKPFQEAQRGQPIMHNLWLNAGRQETTEHLLFHCTKAAEFCASLGVPIPPTGVSAYDILSTIKVGTVPQQQHSMLVVLCWWQLWRRNGAVFRNELSSLRQLLIDCSSEARQWKARLPRRQKPIADLWCNLFQEGIQTAL